MPRALHGGIHVESKCERVYDMLPLDRISVMSHAVGGGGPYDLYRKLDMSARALGQSVISLKASVLTDKVRRDCRIARTCEISPSRAAYGRVTVCSQSLVRSSDDMRVSSRLVDGEYMAKG